MPTKYQVGTDINGTFTDVAILDHDFSHASVGKRLTSRDNPAEAVIDGFASLDRAREVYRVVLNPETLELNLRETEKLRSARRK